MTSTELQAMVGKRFRNRKSGNIGEIVEAHPFSAKLRYKKSARWVLWDYLAPESSDYEEVIK